MEYFYIHFIVFLERTPSVLISHSLFKLKIVFYRFPTLALFVILATHHSTD